MSATVKADAAEAVTLFYWSHLQLFEERCANLEDAVGWGWGILDSGTGSPDRVEQDGVTILERDALWERIHELDLT